MLRPLSPEGLRQIPVARPAVPRGGESPPANGKRARLRQACQDFEAIFLTYLFKRMRATVPEGGFVEESREQRLFRELLDEHLAARFAESGRTGLAETMYRQIASQLYPPEQDSTATDDQWASPGLKPLAAPAEDTK